MRTAAILLVLLSTAIQAQSDTVNRAGRIADDTSSVIDPLEMDPAPPLTRSVRTAVAMDAGDGNPLDAPGNTKIPGDDSKNNDFGLSERVALIAGAGFSYSTEVIYKLPIVDKSTGFVKVEEADRFRPNITIGITYTPHLVNRKRTIWEPGESADGEPKKRFVYDYYPKGFSYAVFINPVSLTNTSNTVGTTVDLGLGLGYRAGPFSVYGSAEFFGLNQPRKYIIDEYGANNKQYIVDDEVQLSMDPNDTSLFDKKYFIAIGLKFAYTFDLVKSFSKSIADDQAK